MAPSHADRLTRDFLIKPGRMHAIFVVAWKTQSILASIAFLGLVAFGSLLVALPIMLTWALIATVVYAVARSKGYPDLLESGPLTAGAPVGQRARSMACSCAKVWFSGINAFVYTRASHNALSPSHRGWRNVLRCGVLFLGMMFFGVATSEHLLRRAGFQGRQLLQLSLAGAFLNVPYRILLSAALTQALWQVAHVLTATASI